MQRNAETKMKIETQIQIVKQVARSMRGLVLDDAAAAKHVAAIVRNGFEDDEYGQGFLDAASEYFAN